MKTEQERIKILGSIIDTFGIKQQQEMIIEECSELILAMQKLKRAKSNHNHEEAFFKKRLTELQGEIADVSIMIMQAKMMFGSNDIEEIIDQKLDRIVPRLHA